MKLSSGERRSLASALLEAREQGKIRETTWRLITGAPGSGKTTLTNRMAAAGWTTIDDPGRAEFEAQLQAGFGPESVREKYLEFQRLVLKRILKNISALPDNEQAFFDYGIAESLAFMKVAGIPWDDEIVKAAATLHFKQIFLLDLVPLPRSTKDLIRNESDTSRKRLRDLILELYQALGQDPIIIPPISVEERFEMVSRILRAERH